MGGPHVVYSQLFRFRGRSHMHPRDARHRACRYCHRVLNSVVPLISLSLSLSHCSLLFQGASLHMSGGSREETSGAVTLLSRLPNVHDVIAGILHGLAGSSFHFDIVTIAAAWRKQRRGTTVAGAFQHPATSAGGESGIASSSVGTKRGRVDNARCGASETDTPATAVTTAVAPPQTFASAPSPPTTTTATASSSFAPSSSVLDVNQILLARIKRKWEAKTTAANRACAAALRLSSTMGDVAASTVSVPRDEVPEAVPRSVDSEASTIRTWREPRPSQRLENPYAQLLETLPVESRHLDSGDVAWQPQQTETPAAAAAPLTADELGSIAAIAAAEGEAPSQPAVAALKPHAVVFDADCLASISRDTLIGLLRATHRVNEGDEPLVHLHIPYIVWEALRERTWKRPSNNDALLTYRPPPPRGSSMAAAAASRLFAFLQDAELRRTEQELTDVQSHRAPSGTRPPTMPAAPRTYQEIVAPNAAFFSSRPSDGGRGSTLASPCWVSIQRMAGVAPQFQHHDPRSFVQYVTEVASRYHEGGRAQSMGNTKRTVIVVSHDALLRAACSEACLGVPGTPAILTLTLLQYICGYATRRTERPAALELLRAPGKRQLPTCVPSVTLPWRYEGSLLTAAPHGTVPSAMWVEDVRKVTTPPPRRTMGSSDEDEGDEAGP